MINYSFSIITPTHSKNNLPYLLELYESILSQTYKNWEWVILLNGELLKSHIPSQILYNNKVKIFRYDGSNKHIGFLKAEAFKLAENDIFVEVDHDDILTSDCLEELNIAYQNKEYGFVYSNNAILHMDDEFVPYDKAYGWTYKNYRYKNKDLISMNSFEPSSQAVSFIWYAPDHVRSWRKDIYLDAGGYNPEYFVCEDHDLMLRTFLKTKFYFIPKVLYIYRVTGDNTSLIRNPEIQKTTVNLFLQYAEKIAEKEADDLGLLKVDLGGGINGKPGYKTIDLKNADIIHDLNNGIPLEDNSVYVLNASHIIEHLYDKNLIMKEIHRVLAHGGWAFIEVPSTDGRGAFQDPTHVSYWNENSFLYYTNSYLGNFIGNTDIRFQEFRRHTWYPNDWLKNMNVYITNWWGIANKPGGKRLPGKLEI